MLEFYRHNLAMAAMAVLILLGQSCTADDELRPPASGAPTDTSGSAPAAIHFSYLALGDSYTIGTSLQSTQDRYPVQLVSRLNMENYSGLPPEIIATNGWTTGNLIAATENFEPDSIYDLVSLLIGVNNQFQGRSQQEYAEEFELLLNRALAYAGNDTANLFVLSIPDYGAFPFGSSNAKEIGAEIDEFNEINRSITESYGVTYFDITPISRQAAYDPSLVASDDLHPSGEMYELWVDLIFTDVKQKLDE